MTKELLPNDTEFKTWITQIKKQVRGAQIKASIAVNEEMLELYWNIGKDISERNFEKSYGSKFFEKTSLELKTEFPDAQGFSERNLRYMKRFYMFYTEKLHQVGAESRQIRKLFETRGNTINNFALTLPENESECAKEILKDEYKFDFLSMSEKYEEKDLHKGLEQNLIQFLLELGNGFAFVGSHVPFVVNGDDYELDLLFYHLKLRCYIVVELKVVKFQPEFVSKLNFYCNAVNHMMKDKTDKNTIGLLICKEKNDVVAQWTVENLSEPIGISTYSLKKVLPSEEEIQKTLSENEKNGAENERVEDGKTWGCVWGKSPPRSHFVGRYPLS